MKYLVLVYTIFLLSCNKKIPEQPNIPPLITIKDSFLIDSLLWQIPIDPELKGRSVFTDHAIQFNNKAIFQVLGVGFIAMDSKTGEIEWDLRGKLNYGFFSKPPTLFNKYMYFGPWEVNLENGQFEKKNMIAEGVRKGGFTVFDSHAYFATLLEKSKGNEYYNWKKCPMDNLALENCTTFHETTPKDFDNLQCGFSRGSIIENSNGDTLLIYPLYQNRFDGGIIDPLNVRGYGSIMAFNISKDTIEWYRKNICPSGWTGKAIHDENRLYLNMFTEGVLCIDINSGEIIWSLYDAKEHFGVGGTGMYLKDNKIILIGRDKKSYAFNKNSGKIIWQHTIWQEDNSAGSRGEAGFYNGRIYFNSGWGHLNSVDLETGEYRTYHLPKEVKIPKWNLDLFEPNFQHQPLIVTDDGIIVTSDGYRFMAFEVPDK